MVNVCWLIESGQYEDWGIKLANHLKKRGIYVRFVFPMKNIYDIAVKKDFECEYPGGKGWHEGILSQSELEHLEIKYGSPGLNAIANSDAHFDWLKLKHSERLQVVARHYKFWEGYFDKNPTEYAIFVNPGPVEARTFYNVIRKRSIPFFRIGVGTTNSNFTMNDIGEEQSWSELLDIIKYGPRKLTENEKEKVYNAVKVFTAEIDTDVEPILNWAPSSLRSLLSRFLYYWKQRNWHYDPISEAVFRQFIREFLTFISMMIS